MDTCAQLNMARAPPSNTLEVLEEFRQHSNKFTNFPGSTYGAIWMAMTDTEEEGVWRDHYTGRVASRDVLQTEIGGLREDTAQNCGIILRLGTSLECAERKSLCQFDPFLCQISVTWLGEL